MNQILRPASIALIVFAITGCFQSGSNKQTFKSYNATLDDPSEEPQDSYDTIAKNVPLSQMPNVQAVIQQVDAEHPGIMNCDCAGFQKLVMASLRQKDRNWGYCLKNGSTQTDRFMYGKSGPMADAITNVCSGNSSVWWNPEPNDPGCIWSATQQNPESTVYSCGGNTPDDTGGGSGNVSVPDHSAIVRSVASRFPNLGTQYCAENLRQAMTELRKVDTNWGYCNKPHKNKVPTDILMYRTNNALVDFVASVCDPNASIIWNVLSDGNPDNCVWGETANFPIPGL